MNNSNPKRKQHKHKRLKQKSLSKTSPESSTSRDSSDNNENNASKPLCPLLAKDSEWVDILQTSITDDRLRNNSSEGEVECDNGPQSKPLAIMFPGILNTDPRTLQGMLNKAMSTTEVTRHLVDLGQKANFTFMKQTDRLIPRDKIWLESLTENSNSYCSSTSGSFSGSTSSKYDEGDDDLPERGELRFENSEAFYLLSGLDGCSDTKVHITNILNDLVREVTNIERKIEQ